MAERHLVTEYRVRDTQAAARAGCTTRADHDHGELYDGHDVLFPLPVDEAEQIAGRCDCGAPLYPNGFGVGCGWCGYARRLG